MAHTDPAAEQETPTPEPWRYGPNLAYPVGVYWIQGADGHDIADTVMGEADAKLMTQAPALLAALDDCQKHIVALTSLGPGDVDIDAARASASAARTVIEEAS
jgi:hypothetical protein